MKVARGAAAFENDTSKGIERVKNHGSSILLSVAKLLRPHASYLNARDYAALNDLEKHIMDYMQYDTNILDTINRLVKKTRA